MSWDPNAHPRGPDGRFVTAGGPTRGTQRRVSKPGPFDDDEHAANRPRTPAELLQRLLAAARR